MNITVCLLDVWQEDAGMRQRNTVEAEVRYDSPMFVDVLCEELRLCGPVLDAAATGTGQLLVHVKPDEFDDMRSQLQAAIRRAQDKAAVAMRGMSP